MNRLIQFMILMVAAMVLWACGGSGESTTGTPTGQTGTFKYKVEWPTSRVIPEGTTRFEIRLRQAGDTVGAADIEMPDTEGEIPGVPAGETLAVVYAYDAEGNVLGSGSASFLLRPNTVTQQEVVLEELPPQIEDDRFIIGGTVSVDPEDPQMLRITLPALINRADGTPAEGLTDQNFMVFEDNLRKLPISVEPTEGGGASKADIAVVLDTTGSMGGAIAAVRNSVIEFADAIAASGIDVRFAGIEFGDEMRTQIDFTSNKESFQEWVAGLSAFGGGDGPENPLDAIMVMAEKTNWRPDAQPIILVITDITAHSADSVTPRTVASVIEALRGRFVCHVVSPSGTRAPVKIGAGDNGQGISPKAVAAAEYIDMIADETGGVWTRWPSDGNVDLTGLPIADTIRKGYLIRFSSPMYDRNHTIRLVVRDGDEWLADQIFNAHYKPVRK